MLIAVDPAQWESLRRVVKRLPKSPDSLGSTSLRTVKNAGGRHIAHVVVFVNIAEHDADTTELVDTLAHEATHAASMLLNHVGQDHDGRDEHYAYLVGWITARLWEACCNTLADDHGPVMVTLD